MGARSNWGTLVGAIVAAAAIGACGSSSKTVDSGQVERGIKQSLSTSSAQVTKATCPNDVEEKTGATFTCDVALSTGTTGKVTVKQTAHNEFSYAIKPGSVQMPGATAEAAVKKSLDEQGVKDATVNCPDNIIVKAGTTVTCHVTGASGAAGGAVTFTFSSAEGAIDPASVKTS